jgi:hypothetical protein
MSSSLQLLKVEPRDIVEKRLTLRTREGVASFVKESGQMRQFLGESGS